MAAPSRARETTVGVLFFLALGLLGIFTVLIGELPVFSSTWTFDVLFHDVGGLEKGQDVLYAGGRVGKVKEILMEADRIRVRLEIEGRNRFIYKNTEITIEEKSALGGMRVSMTRGSVAHGSIGPGETLVGKGLNTLTTQIKEAAARISRLSDTANDAITSVKEGKGTIGKLWNEDALYDDLKTAISDLKGSAANFRSISTKIDRGDGILGQLVNDAESGTNLKDILKSWKAISEAIEKGEGAIGHYVMNPDSKKEIRQTIQKVDQFASSVTKLKTHLGASFNTVPDDRYSISKVYLRIEPRDDRYYLVGASFFKINDESRLSTSRTAEDDGTIAKLDAQIAQRFLDDRSVTLRGGLIEGMPGLGLDYLTSWKGCPLVATLEGRSSYDDNRIHEDYDPFLLRAKVDLTLFKYFHVMAGANSLTERPRGMYGIGFEFQDQDLKYLIGALGAGR